MTPTWQKYTTTHALLIGLWSFAAACQQAPQIPAPQTAPAKTSPKEGVVKTLEDQAEPLRALFNQDADLPRLLVLASPT